MESCYRTPFLMTLGFAALFLFSGFLQLRQALVMKEHSLPERVVSLPAPKPLWDFAEAHSETGRLVVYAKEPMPFDSSENKGSYGLYSYLGASEPLNAPVPVYIRAKDPGEDPACKVFVAPLVVQREVVGDSAVYVCGEGQDDLKVAWVEFVGTNLSWFHSSKGMPLRDTPQERCEVDASLLGERFWIGIGWSPLFPYPLTFNFSDAIVYGPLIPPPHRRSAYACQFR